MCQVDLVRTVHFNGKHFFLLVLMVNAPAFLFLNAFITLQMHSTQTIYYLIAHWEFNSCHCMSFNLNKYNWINWNLIKRFSRFQVWLANAIIMSSYMYRFFHGRYEIITKTEALNIWYRHWNSPSESFNLLICINLYTHCITSNIYR